MNIQNSYDLWSKTYGRDVNLTRDLDQKVVRETLTGLGCDSILEVGCGSGKNTAFLSDTGNRVLAVDFSRGMIRAAQRRMSAENVQFLLADFTESWAFRNETFDLIHCSLVLEHIEDLSPFFAEASRTLRMAGGLFISELHPFRQYRGKQATFTRSGTRIRIPSFKHHISEFLFSAAQSGFELKILGEHWHDSDPGGLPRLVSFMFIKGTEYSND